MKIYLDNCCYNRLFDDRSNIKNYLEREAILIIMQKAYDGEEEIIGSDILDIEISKIINAEKRNDVEGVYRSLISNVVEIDERIKSRAEEIIKLSSRYKEEKENKVVHGTWVREGGRMTKGIK